jgi:hypothetical protein
VKRWGGHEWDHLLIIIGIVYQVGAIGFRVLPAI